MITKVASSGARTQTDGDTGSATLSGSTLTLECKAAGVVLMSAVIDCYQGPGTYTVPAGALVLGSRSSDRPCTLGAELEEGTIRGFIGCDSPTGDPDNIFDDTGPPIGLGGYTLPFVTAADAGADGAADAGL
jgi:hypothetical protein